MVVMNRNLTRRQTVMKIRHQIFVTGTATHDFFDSGDKGIDDMRLILKVVGNLAACCRPGYTRGKVTPE